ncbi:hypothetical protein JOD24_001108 [Kroppenstedtia sanguinis]|uniref:Uncharacterized protein n=1 Tax=Kroppenstedtia sanguinis TaxID=1380684 RepID=A0ABW4C4C7_9BACL
MLPKRDLGAEATLARLVPCGCKATFAPWALQFEVKDAPQALQSRWAEALE